MKVKIHPRLGLFVEKVALADGKSKGQVIEDCILLLVAVRTALPPSLVVVVQSALDDVSSQLEDGN